MIIGLIFASPLLNRAPRVLNLAAAAIVGAAGCWNVLWYAVRNIPDKWGWLALISGILMVITAAYIARSTRLPGFLTAAKIPVLIGLLACAFYYAQTIYHL